MLEFLGRRIHAPLGPERLARLAKAPVVPVLLRRVGRVDYELTFGSQLHTPGEPLQEGELTRRIMGTIEAAVQAEPHRWWCWEIFEQLMAADRDAQSVGDPAR